MVESTNSWRDELLVDSNFKLDISYNYELLISLLNEVTGDIDNINPYKLCLMLQQITKPFKTLSSAMSKMGEKIGERVTEIRTVFNKYDDSSSTLQQCLENELQIGVNGLTGENNKKSGYGKDSKYYQYISVACACNRLIFFLNFVKTIFHYFNTTSNGTDKCMKLAFEDTLGKVFGWLKKKAFGVALSFVSSKRDEFYLAFLGDKTISDDSTAKINELGEKIALFQEYLQKYISSNGLTIELEF